MGRKTAATAEAALDEAQALIYDAWDATTAKRRIALAKKALATSPLCADAYVLLAEHAARGSDEELDLLRRGVAAGEAALGEAGFAAYAGRFWGFIETRPYMRARHGLAFALWRRGDRDAAIDQLHAMLDLNPNDNQGVRYLLAAWLIEAGRDDDLARLLAAYPNDGMADWAWTQALAAFRRAGDTDESRKLLAEAQEANSHVAPYLLGARPLPTALPPYISAGGEDEAMHYVTAHRAGWTQTQGALDWLRAQAPAPPPAKRRPRRTKEQ